LKIIYIKKNCPNIVVSLYLVKKPIQIANPKNPIKINGLKLTYSKWHFGQVGHGDKHSTWGQTFHMRVFLINFSGKKIMISCSEKNQSKLIFKNYMLREIFGNFITIFFCVGLFFV